MPYVTVQVNPQGVINLYDPRILKQEPSPHEFRAPSVSVLHGHVTHACDSRDLLLELSDALSAKNLGCFEKGAE